MHSSKLSSAIGRTEPSHGLAQERWTHCLLSGHEGVQIQSPEASLRWRFTGTNLLVAQHLRMGQAKKCTCYVTAQPQLVPLELDGPSELSAVGMRGLLRLCTTALITPWVQAVGGKETWPWAKWLLSLGHSPERVSSQLRTAGCKYSSVWGMRASGLRSG